MKYNVLDELYYKTINLHIIPRAEELGVKINREYDKHVEGVGLVQASWYLEIPEDDYYVVGWLKFNWGSKNYEIRYTAGNVKDGIENYSFDWFIDELRKNDKEKYEFVQGWFSKYGKVIENLVVEVNEQLREYFENL